MHIGNASKAHAIGAEAQRVLERAIVHLFVVMAMEKHLNTHGPAEIIEHCKTMLMAGGCLMRQQHIGAQQAQRVIA